MVDAAVKSSSPAPDDTADTTPARCSIVGRVVLDILRLISRVPFSIRSSVGWGLGFVAGCIPTRELRVTKLQLNRFLGVEHPGPLSRRVFAHAGRYMLQVLNLEPMTQPPLSHIRCENWQEIESWLAEGRPIVALTAHTGNWDLLAAYVIARGVGVTTIGREARSPLAHELLKGIRDSYGVETIWRSDRSGLKRIVNCLREKRVLAALIDQDTRVESDYVPFFGTPVKTPSSLVALGKKFNARFVTAFIFQTSSSCFELFVREIKEDSDSTTILTEYSARLEQLIRQYPEQWVWFHKRWRTQPGEETMGTTRYLEWLSICPE
jgi:KDO2-lipid IV(A) lauroyltransferase